MTTSIDIDRDRAWAEYEAGYKAAYSEAVAEKHCFCTCGCKDAVEELGWLGTPARCKACRFGSKHEHALIKPAIETFDWARYEPAQKPKATRLPHRRISRGERQEAESYVRKTGRTGFKTLRRLHARLVDAGQSLTNAQAADALRSKAADERAEAAAAIHSEKAEWRARRVIDLNRVVITDDVAPGDYGVRDDNGWFVRVNIKDGTGPLHGFVMVRLEYGDGIVKTGLQYPGPGQTYRGEAAHLVARLVSNPDEAKALFQQSLEEAV